MFFWDLHEVSHCSTVRNTEMIIERMQYIIYIIRKSINRNIIDVNELYKDISRVFTNNNDVMDNIIYDIFYCFLG